MKTQRWRITFAKTEAMRFTSHLDLILTWERTFRRSGLPLAYSEGFNPRPVINLAAPLPLGFTSSGEIGDFWLTERMPAREFSGALRGALPPGLALLSMEEIPRLHGDKLPSLVQAAVYQIELDSAYPGLPDRVRDVLGATKLPRVRKGRSYDLRPLILGLSLISPGGPESTAIKTKLALLPGATGRPEEVLSALDLPLPGARICREKIFLKPELEQP